MKHQIIAGIVGIVALVIFSGCAAANHIAAGIAEKSISGDGYVGVAKTGIDAATKTPTVNFVLVKGAYTSVPSGMEYIEYSESADASIFNSSATTKKKRLVFASSEHSRVDRMLETAKQALSEDGE